MIFNDKRVRSGCNRRPECEEVLRDTLDYGGLQSSCHEIWKRLENHECWRTFFRSWISKCSQNGTNASVRLQKTDETRDRSVDDKISMSSLRHEIFHDYQHSWWSLVKNLAILPCVIGDRSVILKFHIFDSVAAQLRFFKSTSSAQS